MAGIIKDGQVYAGKVDIDDNIISSGKTWSSEKISKINVSDAKKVDSKPTYSDGTITYVKDGTSYTTTNSKQWFYYLENGSLKQTIFIDGEELTIDGASVNFSEYIKKTSIATTLDSSCTNEQVAGAKDVYDSIENVKILSNSYFIDKGITSSSTLDDIVRVLPSYRMAIIQSADYDNYLGLPNAMFTITIARFTINRIQIIATEKYSPSRMYIGICSNSSGSDKYDTWRRVCTTSVADVPRTIITDKLASTKVSFTNSDSYVSYYVKNGDCYVTIWSMKILEACSVEVIFKALPKSAIGVTRPLCNGKESFAQIFISPNSSNIAVNASADLVGKNGYCSLSYPVAES